jgi:hypothetical protein
MLTSRCVLVNLPLDGIKTQPSPVHFFAKPLRLLPRRIAHEAVRATGSNVKGNLLADTAVKRLQTFVAQKANIAHWNRPTGNAANQAYG